MQHAQTADHFLRTVDQVPELPDISVYVQALRQRVVGQRLRELRIGSPFVLRTVHPSPGSLAGSEVHAVDHLAKQVVLSFDDNRFCVIHLMIAGRLHWKAPNAPLSRRNGLAAWLFEGGSLHLTEAGSKRRAAIHLLDSSAALAALDRGGLDPLEADLETFRERLARTNHTLKRALTDQRILAGIGNAYSDEILFAARLSPLQKTANLDDEAWRRLHLATANTLRIWRQRLADQAGDEFPKKVTAFRPEMAVHGRFGLPCRVCQSPIQRIQYASNESNYCARCQTGGRLLSDRVLARLLKSGWPATIDELE